MAESLEEQLMRHEGIRTKPYLCSAGKLTVGVGHNLDDKPLSQAIIRQLLAEDIQDARRDLYREWPEFRTGLPDDARQVLENMCFNIGIGRLKGFKRMIAALRARDYDKAADELLDSKYAKQVGDGPGQRADELAMMMRGCA